MHFVYSVAALFHGLLLALLVFLAMLFGAKLSRRGARSFWFSSLSSTSRFLTFLFPDPLGAHYEHCLFGA